MRNTQDSFIKNLNVTVDRKIIADFAVNPPKWVDSLKKFEVGGIIEPDSAKRIVTALRQGKFLIIDDNPLFFLPLNGMPKILDDMSECVREGTKMGGTFPP